MIATITVKDPEKFQQYLAKTQEVAAPYGAELLFRGYGRQDSDRRKQRSRSSTSGYGSVEYQPLISLRDEGTEMKMTSYEVMG